MLAAVVRWFSFVVIGVLTVAVGELQYSVFIRGDWANLYGSMFFNALYLSGWFFLILLFFRVLSRRSAFLVTLGLATIMGLMVEWFSIGNSPWGNPDASQVGMAAYWSCLVIVPLILIDRDANLRGLKRTILTYGLVYTAVVIGMQFILPANDWRVAFHIWSVVLGYLGLIILCVVGYLRRLAGQSIT